MKTLCINTCRKPAHYLRHLTFVGLMFGELLITASNLTATTNHPPFVSWIPDQRLTSASDPFATEYFRILDYDGYGFSIAATSSNPMYYSTGHFTVSACSTSDPGYYADGSGYKVVFSDNPGSDDVTTIRLAVTESTTGLVGYTSFTLQRDITGQNSPVISTLPNYTVPMDPNNGYQATYTTRFVIGDLDQGGKDDINSIDSGKFTFTSSNTNVLDPTTIHWALMPPDQDYLPDEGNRSYLLTATTKPNSPGTTVVTLTVPDPDKNTASTSFVLQVPPASNAVPSIDNAPSPDYSTFQEQVLPAANAVHNFTVSDNSPTNELKVSAFSSNTNLVPNDFQNNLIVTQPDANGNGSVKIIPVTPLPSPSPGMPQAATITLSVTDNAYIRQTTFLYVLAPPAGGVATSFSRPSGVYLLNPTGLTDRPLDTFLTGEQQGETVTWAKLESAPIHGLPQYTFDDVFPTLFTQLPGGQDLSLNLQEEPCDIAATPTCDQTGGVQPCLQYPPWCDKDDPNELMDCSGNNCDGGVLRAVPWDSYLRDRRNNFLKALAKYLSDNHYIGRITIINPNLPGGDTGFRNGSVPEDMQHMSGYSRGNLLWAAQDELRNIQDNFPEALVQFGFFEITDSLGPAPDGDGTYNEELWQWLYRDANNPNDASNPNYRDNNGNPYLPIADEFNGIMRPRISFFQEDLGATRTSETSDTSETGHTLSRGNAPNYITPSADYTTSVGATAYTISPGLQFLPSFAYYYTGTNPSDDQLNQLYNNGTVFQANTVWSAPFIQDMGDQKLLNNINGSPNDALEGAFNAYTTRYLEVYLPDVDQAQPIDGSDAALNATLWAGELRSWHDYAQYLRNKAPLEGPAGLTVDRASATSNTVSWKAVYGAVNYQVQEMVPLVPPGTPGGVWVDAGIGNPGDLSRTFTDSTGSEYAYRVRAVGQDGHDSAWSYVAVFLSEAADDGYVKFNGTTRYMVHTTDPQPGIIAGEPNLTPVVHDRGFLSFNTGDLGSSTTVLGARLRLYQSTAGGNFSSNNQCKVDIKKGSFSGDAALHASDYYGTDQTTTDAFVITNAGQNQWFDYWLPQEMAADNISVSSIGVNDPGHTQFRLYFPEGSAPNYYEAWYAGDDPTFPPQLIVQYR